MISNGIRSRGCFDRPPGPNITPALDLAVPWLTILQSLIPLAKSGPTKRSDTAKDYRFQSLENFGAGRSLLVHLDEKPVLRKVGQLVAVVWAFSSVTPCENRGWYKIVSSP